MAVFAVSTTKRITWRGEPQEFSNVYHFRTQLGQPFPDISVMDYIITQEKLVHSSNVTFVKARSWGPTDEGAALSVTRQIKDYTGYGSITPSSSAYLETAILCYWPLGRYGSRNHPQYLRKWLHTGGATHSYDPRGTDGWTTEPLAIRTYMDRMRKLDPTIISGEFELCTFDGKLPIGVGAPYKYLEHRQLGR